MDLRPEGREPLKTQRRSSFLAMKALRSSLSISSQVSSSSEPDSPSSAPSRKKALTRNRTFDALRGDLLIRRYSKSSVEDYTDRGSTSTRPTSPSATNSRSASISGDFLAVIKSGPLQPETSVLKSKNEYLVLTSAALTKFKSRSLAVERFPQISASSSAVEITSPTDSTSSFKGLGAGGDLGIPLERIVSILDDGGGRPSSFGIEVWWSDPKGAVFSCLQLEFSQADDRAEWLKQIRHAVKLRARSLREELVPCDVELELKQMIEAQQARRDDAGVEIFPVVPRRPYTRLGTNSGEAKKGWRENSSFYVAFTKNFCIVAHFMRPSPSHKASLNSLVQFGLVTLSKVNVALNEERFDLVFRLPLDQPRKLELSSRHHRNILLKFYKADAYLKPAWPLWTRREVFFVNGEAQQTPLPNGEDYGGFKTTLDAFIQGYHCAPVHWTVQWKDVQYPPQFCLLAPKEHSRYTALQLLAVFRALRFNDFFKSLSFCGIDFTNLGGIFDNAARLGSTVWLSRTGKCSLTRNEFEVVENSPVLFQEIVALLLGSESIRHIDLSYVLGSKASTPSSENGLSISAPTSSVCEIVPPIVLLWKSLQTRCNSVNLSGNPLSTSDVAGLCRILQTRTDFLKTLSVARCRLDENALILLWEALHEQRSTIEIFDVSHNSGRIDARRAAETLSGASRLRRLNLAYSIKGNLSGPLFKPWSVASGFEPWLLEELDLSGWKVNFDTLCGIMKFVELDESRNLRRLALTNCGLSGEMATGILCRLGGGRDVHLLLGENPLESVSTDWIDLIHGNEAPKMVHLDMIQFQHESNFNRLLRALTNNKTIEFLSMVGTGPPNRASAKTSELLSRLFGSNDTLRFLDLSGYSGKLEDVHLGWGLAGAMGGLKQNTTLRQLRVRNHDIGAGEDVSELCRVLAANKGLAMFDCQNNNFNHHQFAKLVQALSANRRIVSFPLAAADRESAVQKERSLFLKHQTRPEKSFPAKILKASAAAAVETRLEGLLRWVEKHWDTEADRAREIIERNRDRNPEIRALDLELPRAYLDAWDDPSLPAALARARARARELKSHEASEGVSTAV
ncbi:RNI-like protein [Durotheca rogersii]|uniref:RNI-like protein n=1 Tax=Durotheca rogersii TaxID=419775 RepID=UPI00221F92F1|nr:RNI-like protein [Durotheca rogersii]KAI5863091.1 RNI-like protein [Durotheca rogersii]